MTKAEEIKILEKLANSDSYFANQFTPNEINQMISNIINDFPLLFGTKYELKNNPK